MGRPRRSTKEEFYDVFSDFDIADQEIVLAFLTQILRQAKRQASKRFAEPAKVSEQPMLDGLPKPDPRIPHGDGESI